tara:strand:- start:233 stop:484 length:252 start_codon:yes stop_codon:yes gene_type:complete
MIDYEIHRKKFDEFLNDPRRTIHFNPSEFEISKVTQMVEVTWKSQVDDKWITLTYDPDAEYIDSMGYSEHGMEEYDNLPLEDD